tara:strand:+ start:2951 stop:3439 length:489 start_codon:yes stop_codon:yes gene_type:complete
MAVQSKDSYSLEHKPLHAGQLADLTLFNTASGLPVVDIEFGLGVVRDGNKIKVPASAAEVQNDFLGVVMYELNRSVQSGQDGKVLAGYDATVITEGHVAVVVTEAVAVGDAVCLQVSGDAKGKFCKTKSGNQILDAWEFKSAGSDIAVIGPKSNIVLPVASE